MKRVRKTFKKYFVPHEENEHKPHLLRPRTVAFVLLVALVVESFLVLGTSYLAPNSRLFGIVVANALVDETNQSRSSNAVSQLNVDPLLVAAARDKANDMAANGYFAHTSPAGLTPWYWFGKVGYNFEYAGENLAVNFSDSQDVTNAWMNSPEHRANILDSNFTQIGIATATGTYKGQPAVYVVELFGTPVPLPPPSEAIAFVNSASAAGTEAGVSTTKTSTIATTSKPVAKVTKPKQAPKVIPTIVATSGSQTATSNQTFVAVKGASTQTVPVAGVSTTAQNTSGTATAPAAPSAPIAAAIGTVVPQSNPIQKAASNPRAIVDDIYIFIIALFALALGINLFVKIRIQHPQLIFGGMLVILIAGLLIVLNLHLLGGAVIL